MEKKSFSTWYRCLFCTRVFPEASQLIAHRKFYHALQWEQRKLAKKTVRYENNEVQEGKSGYLQSQAITVSPEKFISETGSPKDYLQLESNRNPENGNGYGLNCNSEIGDSGSCSEKECNGNCETLNVEPELEGSVVTTSEDTDTNAVRNQRINFLDIKIQLSDLIRKERSPERNVNSEVYDSSKTIVKDSPLRKSARLLSPMNLSVAKMTDCILRETDTIKFQFKDKKVIPVGKPRRDIKPKQRFVCSVCSKSFTLKTSLFHHEITHLKRKPYKCEICSKTFTQKGNLKTHKMLHTGEFPFKCNLCHRNFRTKAFLTAHEIVHRNDRDFKCFYCNGTFRSKGILKTHSLKVHGVSTYGNSNNVME